jgi:hypothetical protein
MGNEFFDRWWKTEGCRLLVADKTAPNLQDYAKAAYLAGYRKSKTLHDHIQRMRAAYDRAKASWT